MATSVSPFTDRLPKAKYISDNTNFSLGVRITELFKIKIKVDRNDDAVLITDAMLEKKRKFVEKAQIRHIFVLLGGGRTRSRRKYVAC